MKKILFAASECVPFVKTGGLADVVGALPKGFDKNEYDVRVVLPMYTCIPQKYSKDFKYLAHFYMGTGEYIKNEYVGIMEYELNGIKYYFIDNKRYFSGPVPYGDIRGDIEKFCFFCKAVLSILPVVDFRPDIIHCHDWQTGIIPVYLKNEFAVGEFYRGIRTIMTIHNLRFQGRWDIKTMKGLTGFGDYLFTPDKLEYNKDANMLKGGLVYADFITTVSETYAREIQSAEYGEGLDGLLRARGASLCGIVNGIDYDIFDPATDKLIPHNYDSSSFWAKKWLNKTALQEELGLPVDRDKYVIGLISRLTDQKGLDLIEQVINGIVDDFTQFIIIGTGDRHYEDMFKGAAWYHQGKLSANILYSEELSHKLYAAADAMLVPSKFEPCGLTQLMALRYGTVPIVRETGGLRDTVPPYNEYNNTGLGFSFTHYNAGEMLNTINYSKKVFFDQPGKWQAMVKRGMETDYSWSASIVKYKDLYDWIISW